MSGSFLGEKWNKRVPDVKLGYTKALVQEGQGKFEECREQRGWRGGQWPCKWQRN